MKHSLNSVYDVLSEPAQELFFSRGDEEDTRMGDIVLHKREHWIKDIENSNSENNIDVAILGVPQDEGVKRNRGREGARKAPTEIRRALYKLTPFIPKPQHTKHIRDIRIADIGDITIREGSSLEETHERLENVVSALMAKGIIPIVLGGGHDISYPNFCGFASNTQSVGVINIDTHLDYRPAVPMRHSGTSFRLMLDDEQQRLKAENFVEFGIQPFANVEAHYSALRERGANVMMLDELREKGFAHGFAEALHIAAHNTERIMVSFDMDAVRSSDAPGVSAPLPTGLFAEDILEAALQTGKNGLVRLIDIAEVNPDFDLDNRTAKLAALVVMHFLSGFCQRVP